MEILYKEESYQIMGLSFEVYNELGNGFDEAVYHESKHSNKFVTFVVAPQGKTRTR